jgi:SAM-dependent methyltransferase
LTETLDLKARHRSTWASGDYERIALGLRSVADHVVRAAAVRSGERVLDLACGTGNTALAAAARGARVTGLDLTPEMLDVARRRAQEERFDALEWRTGDAEDLPFGGATFDVVLSSCGVMFAPDPERAAAEIARVTKPGGRIALQAWTPDGGVARLFAVSARHVPPPAGLPSPFAWGDEAQVRARLGGTFRSLRFERGDCPEFADRPERVADLFLEAYGPTHRAWLSLPPERAPQYRADLVELFRGYVTPADGKVRWGREYVIALGTRA